MKRFFHHTLFFVVGVCAVLLGSGIFSTANASLLAPDHGSQITLVIGDRESPYFKLPADSSTSITVTGPGNLSLLVRPTLPATSGPSVEWKLRVEEGSTEVNMVDTTSLASGAAWKESPLRPAVASRVVVNVPSGSHRYTIKLTTPAKTFVGIRYLFSVGAAKPAKSAVYPIDMLGTTSVSIKEKVIDFFLADSARAVKVKVIGPTQLRIVTRLAYTGVMKGPQKYGALVSLDGNPPVITSLETSKSPATYFTNHKEWSVGESRTIYFDVPVGTHEVSVRLGASGAPALAMRFTIPKEDINP